MNKKIFYASTYNADDLSNWSGLGFHLKKMLTDQFFAIQSVFPLEYTPGVMQKIKAKFNPKWILPRGMSVCRNYSKQIDSLIDGESGIIFSPGTLPVAFLKSKNPLVIYSDATFASMANYYPEFKEWSQRSLKVANTIERYALERADLLIYASEWAAHSAINDYGINPSKVKVVPFGANLIEEPDFETVHTSIKNKQSQPLQLLFIGVDWERKGGQIVLDIFRFFKAKGVNVHLNIAGPKTNPLKDSIAGVTYYGFLSKSNSRDSQILTNLFLKANFFIMLSTSECYGLVYCEANAYGTPAIGFNTGGVPSVIKNSNGVLFDMNSSTEEICDRIIDIYQSKEGYYDLCVSSYEMFIDRLNWKTAGSQIKQLLDTL